MRHIISVLMANEAGALLRVAGLFSSRGYNIESLCVAPTENPSVSRLTMVTSGSDEIISQINKQLAKLVDVVDLADMTRGDHIERELLFIKLKLDELTREEVAECVGRYGGEVLDERSDSYTVQLTGTGLEVDDFIKEIRGLSEILEVVRSGAAAIAHGPQVLKLID
ncbi:MAG: acetolactate synthase small subunit [Salinisphaeraceae bacterium]|nr:acetolactate synthase small subunit [Salinisphaeraceae bacterium]